MNEHRYLPKNTLLRTLAINWLIGFGVTVIMLAAMLYFDTAHLWTLISTANDPYTPTILLFLGLLITLSSVAMGTAIMSLPYDDKGGPDKGTREAVIDLEGLMRKPARATVNARSQRRH